MDDYYKVDVQRDLARDPKTGAIINVNSRDYKKYVTQRGIKEKKNQNLDSMKNDLDSLKGEMNEIKSLLRELVNGK